eukprot:121233-Pyramimonas_sp.AAC.1
MRGIALNPTQTEPHRTRHGNNRDQNNRRCMNREIPNGIALNPIAPQGARALSSAHECRARTERAEGEIGRRLGVHRAANSPAP